MIRRYFALLTISFVLSITSIAHSFNAAIIPADNEENSSYHVMKLEARLNELELKMEDLFDQIEKIDSLLAQMSAQLNSLEEGRPVEVLSADYNRSEFEYGFEMLMQSKLDLAYDSFSLFIKKYPNDLKVGDAYFWLGEVEYQRGAYDKALENYLAIYKDYKSASKRNDALFKMSLVLGFLEKKQEACDGLVILINHTPNVTPSLEQKARLEAINLGCLN